MVTIAWLVSICFANLALKDTKIRLAEIKLEIDQLEKIKRECKQDCYKRMAVCRDSVRLCWEKYHEDFRGGLDNRPRPL